MNTPDDKTPAVQTNKLNEVSLPALGRYALSKLILILRLSDGINPHYSRILTLSLGKSGTSMKLSFITLLCFTVLLFSCQKAFDNSSTPVGNTDSAWYINSFVRAGLEYYHVSTNTSDTSRDQYDYMVGKIIHKAVYTDGINRDSSQSSFYYDANNRFIKYDNDYTSNDTVGSVKTIVFNYSGDKVTDAAITYFGGQHGKQQFSYSADGKIITVYDTLANSTQYEDITMYKYYFNDNHKLDSQILITPYSSEITKLNYDVLGTINRYQEIYQPQAITFNTRENKGAEVSNTFHKLLQNLWYHYFVLANTNDALLFNNGTGYIFAINEPYPVITATDDLGAPALFANTFNASNQLIKQVLPDNFGSKAGGPSVFEFSYIKTLK